MSPIRYRFICMCHTHAAQRFYTVIHCLTTYTCHPTERFTLSTRTLCNRLYPHSYSASPSLLTNTVGFHSSTHASLTHLAVVYRGGRSLHRGGRSLHRGGRSLHHGGRSLHHGGRSLHRATITPTQAHRTLGDSAKLDDDNDAHHHRR